MSLNHMGIELLGIADVIASNSIQVPVYQRSYAWEKEHVQALFDDISNAIAEKENEYFLGSLVAAGSKDGRFEVVDGQQRLATTTILIAAIRDHLLGGGESDKQRGDDINSRYLVEKDLWSQEATPRLRLNDSDHDYFAKRVLSHPTSKERKVLPARESHRLISGAGDLAKKHVDSVAGIGSKPTERLKDLLDYLTKKAKTIWVTVPDHANAFVIFETLNDRGLALAISDLLKNYLFLTSGDRITEVQKHWVAMFAVLEAAGMETDAVDFIRHHWSSREGATRETQLYSAIKKEVNSKQAAIDLASELEDEVKLYAAIQNPNHAYWKQFGPTTQGHMATINLLRMVQIRPLLLAVLGTLHETEIKETLRLMVSWGVRFLIVKGLGGGTLESRYCAAAIKVRKGEIKTAGALSSDLADVIPPDSQFKSVFASVSVSYAYRARYYLRVLERQSKGVKQPEWIPNPNQEEVNLEHVLPQNQSDSWAGILPETAAAYAKRLGNLALMKEQMNSLVANDSFEQKRTHLAASEYGLTKMIGQEKEWGVSQIEARQFKLAELAVAAWPAQ